jgi:hypothetical protein
LGPIPNPQSPIPIKLKIISVGIIKLIIIDYCLFKE